MSNMFDYDDVDSLFEHALDNFEPINNESLQIYVLKFVFGLIDNERRKIHSDKAKQNIKTKPRENRLCMLKSLAALIAEMEFDDD